jgi:hypothetical protein
MELRRVRILEAQRFGLRNRIRDEWRVPESRADELLAGWDQEALERGLSPDQPTFWREGEAWIWQHLEGRRTHGGGAGR